MRSGESRPTLLVGLGCLLPLLLCGPAAAQSVDATRLLVSTDVGTAVAGRTWADDDILRYDAGSFSRVLEGAAIFADGFESGATGAWSI